MHMWVFSAFQIFWIMLFWTFVDVLCGHVFIFPGCKWNCWIVCKLWVSICLFVYLFLTLLGFHCCEVFSVVEERGVYSLLWWVDSSSRWAQGHTGFSSCSQGSVVVVPRGSRAHAQLLWSMDLVVLLHVRSFQPRGWTHVPLHWQADSLQPGYLGSTLP